MNEKTSDEDNFVAGERHPANSFGGNAEHRHPQVPSNGMIAFRDFYSLSPPARLTRRIDPRWYT